jgi:hypothetical protein
MKKKKWNKIIRKQESMRKRIVLNIEHLMSLSELRRVGERGEWS